jgi:Sulfatase
VSLRLEGAARLVAVGFWVLTAVFAWLISVPFAYQNFIKPRLLPDFVTFAERHGQLAVLLWPIGWLSLRSALVHPRSRGVARGVLALWGAAGLVLPWLPSLAQLPTDGRAIATSAAALLFPLASALADFLRAPTLDEGPDIDRTGHDAVAALLAAGLVFVWYNGMALSQGHAPGQGIGVSALTHLLTAAAILLGFTALRALAALRERPVYAEFWLATVVFVGALASVMSGLVLPALSVTGTARWLGGVALASTLALVLSARGRIAGAAHGDGVLTALSGVIPTGLGRLQFRPWLLWLSSVAALGWGGPAVSRVLDWNFLVLTLSVLSVWLLAVGGALAVVRTLMRPGVERRLHTRGVLAGCAGVLGLYVMLVPAPTHAGTAGPVDAWTVADPSFRTLRDALRPPAPADVGFYPFLQRHTNLGPDVAVRAFDIRHAPLSGPPAAYRPHVFLIVIDSLRRDYLSPYNDAVTFTPAIGRFASESLAFQRTFTRYGATGLSVPSIWVGGLVPHQQYPKPYGPFNALHALLAHEQYETWLSWDNVVDAVVPREGSGPPLSANRAVKDFRFCEMIGDVRARLNRVSAGGPPVFTWGLAQDVHISAITREGGQPLDTAGYPGFDAAHASRLKRLDGCFGAFVDDLKSRGLFDDSIVIVTSDHGDSLGEEGRWGHAYTLFPEVLQVPLIVHLPARLRERFDVDLSAASFTADITPTLYTLLGHQTTRPGPMFGEALVWPKGAQPGNRRSDGVLVASSYGSVYGWITDDGRGLYVSDGVSLRDYRYELDGSPTGRALAVGVAERQAGQSAIKEALTRLASFYRLELD